MVNKWLISNNAWTNNYVNKVIGFTRSKLCKIPDFGVSTVILDTTNISRSWSSWTLDCCEAMLNPIISLKGETWVDNIFTFLIKFLEIIDRKELGQPFWIMILVYYYLLNGIRLESSLDSSCWIQKIPNLTTNNINIWFFTHRAFDPGKSNLLKVILSRTA